jgi:hypothetical protein
VRDCGKQITLNDLVLFDEVDSKEILKKDLPLRKRNVPALQK